jgi:hypothetical protein
VSPETVTEPKKLWSFGESFDKVMDTNDLGRNWAIGDIADFRAENL